MGRPISIIWGRIDGWRFVVRVVGWSDGLGRSVTDVTAPGTVNGKDGVFEWVIDNETQTIIHRLFRPY
jgi:hypothetical protein